MLKSRQPFAAELRSCLELLVALTFAILLFSTLNPPRSVQASHNPRLAITEVYANATTSDVSTEANEWVEIQNLERHPVNLDGWTIEDAQAIARLPDFELAGGATAVIAGDAANIVVPGGRTLIVLDTARIGTGLRNAGDRIALVNPFGVRYDAVSWGDVRTPRHMDPPNPRQSIIRTPIGGQRMTDSLTPWTTGEAISARPERYKHPRPDTRVRIMSARLQATAEDSQSVTIENTSADPLITVNWTLTVGASLVKVRSVRLDPGETYTITDTDDRLGGGLSKSGGHVVLRDARGNWLATASWGDDQSFHHMAEHQAPNVVQFNPLKRIHPRIPWHERFDEADRLIVGSGSQPHNMRYQEISRQLSRDRDTRNSAQESETHVVWISEVYPTAGQGRNDAAYEWFEITNSSDDAVDLTGWTIADNRSVDSLGQLIIPPRSSVVIGASTDTVEGAQPLISDGRIGNGLANSGDRLMLINTDGEVVSALSWGDDETHTRVKSPKADESIQRSSADSPPQIATPTAGNVPPQSLAAQEVPAESQEAAGQPNEPTDIGTEAAVARQDANAEDVASQPTLSITEILPAPLPGEAEWIEIFNPTEETINLSGWSIGDLARRTALAGTIAAGARLIVTTAQVDSLAPILVVARIGNGLNNDADTLTLYDASERVVFAIAYGDDALPAPGPGLSIALDPARWVVTAIPTPGSADVTPLLGDSFRSAAIKQPISDEDRLPIVEAIPESGVNAWMIVSFALIGVIFTLILRRWQPPEETPVEAPQPASYSGPSNNEQPATDLERADERDVERDVGRARE